MAGAAGGGATIGGAIRGCGKILRGAGAGVGEGAAEAAGAETARTAGVEGCWAGAGAGFGAIRACRAPSSSSFFFARMAFSTSPGLEICDRSIFGAMPCAPCRAPAPPWPDRPSR